MTQPTAAFTALTPPRWLQHDMAVQAPGYADVKALFLFTDDLPRHQHIRGQDTPEHVAIERVYAYISQIKTVWGHSPETVGLNDVGGLLRPIGSLTSNGKRLEKYERINPLTRAPEYSHMSVSPATHAIITLPPSYWNAQNLTAAVTGIPLEQCATLPEVNPHRIVAAHELAHLQHFNELNKQHAACLNERVADQGAHDYCASIGDLASARYLYEWRLLSNMSNGMATDSVNYWNGLFQHGLSDNKDDELAAQLEVKLLACSTGKGLPAKRDDFVRTAFSQQSARMLEAVFMALPPAAQLRQLESSHTRRAYRFEDSYQLAERTLEAAHRLTPGVFTPTPVLVLA